MTDNDGQHVRPLEMKRVPWNDPDTLVLSDGREGRFFHGVFYFPGRCDCVLWHAFGGRFTCDVPRSEELCIGLVVLASSDTHLAITVRRLCPALL